MHESTIRTSRLSKNKQATTKKTPQYSCVSFKSSNKNAFNIVVSGLALLLVTGCFQGTIRDLPKFH